MQRFISFAGVLALAAVFSVDAAASAKPAAKPPATLRAVVRSLLPHAQNNFAALGGVKYDSDTYYVEYKVLPTSNGMCGSCRLYDQYARGPYAENWYVQERWKSTWTAQKNESYIKGQLTPILQGFSLHRTLKYSYPTLVWRGPHGSWVYADLFSKGFVLRVGRDLTKSVHVLAPPSKSRLADLRSASANVIRLAVPAASDNFSTLRASAVKKNIFGSNDYGVTASFGAMFQPCGISDVANGLGFKDFQPKWALTCRTISMAGTKAALEPAIRAAVDDALPSAFTQVTDAGALLLDDYRWDDNSNMLSVSISSDEEEGIVSFTVWVTHFLPKP